MAITKLRNLSNLLSGYIKQILNIKIKNRPILFWVGLFLLAVSLVGLMFIFLPVVKNEISYFKLQLDNERLKKDPNSLQQGDSSQSTNKKKYMVAADENFSIVIPKIGANAKVIENVDPQNSKEYQLALSQGVAHAKSTPTPKVAAAMGEGNTFLFAHSSDSFFTANQYNSVFYLLTKLENKDYFYIAYDKKLYKYEVIEKNIVSSDSIKYLNKIEPVAGEQIGATATLMTCWPAGTTLKRLVVVGKLVN